MYSILYIQSDAHPVWSRNSTGLKRRGLQPRLVSSDCLLHRLDKANNPVQPGLVNHCFTGNQVRFYVAHLLFPPNRSFSMPCPKSPLARILLPRADAVSSVMKRAFRGTLIGQFRPIHRILPSSAFWLERKGAISLFSYAVLIFKFVSPSYCRPNYCEQLSLTIFKLVTCRSA